MTKIFKKSCNLGIICIIRIDGQAIKRRSPRRFGKDG